ncbi:MAG: hydrogenase formation protein HypD [candidate division WOR-3 bacterium]|nr:hydrogenase formation protein HypD [candidate division WOR-3 bacterium]
MKTSSELKSPITIMEGCGTHTNVIAAAGIRQVLSKNIKLVSGPGCPVCVTAQSDIDWVVALAKTRKAIILTFGDLVKVPGTLSSLQNEKAKGADIRVVYSPLDGLEIARKERKPVVFIGVGFETTAPTIAVAILKAQDKKIQNFYLVPYFKLIPPALRMIATNPNLKIDGFILPGHVSTIIGVKPYQFLAQDYKKPCVIAGFEPTDILEAILLLLNQIKNQEPKIEIQYHRSVKATGNRTAQQIMAEVFVKCDAEWRGLGMIRDSGLTLADKYQKFDARKHFDISVPMPKPTSCRCSDELLGLISPFECRLFARKCTPAKPIGPCMVSSEGACAAYYKYNKDNSEKC